MQVVEPGHIYRFNLLNGDREDLSALLEREEIMRAAVGPTPTDVVVRDVRNVRDRLLTMVEKLVDRHVVLEG